MLTYTEIDRRFILDRAAQYRDQLERWQAGSLSDDEFKPLRLQNGWYLQRHAPMLRVAIPWGQLSSRQLSQLAEIAREFDRGYGHLTTRQNLQFNWISVDRSADVLDRLAQVDMHGIQTSGNCVRNITSDPLAGIAPDELFDVRPYAELLRQWSSVHPEFSFLPRKFKIAMNGSAEDRCATRWHDIGMQAVVNHAGEYGFAFYVGGGMGRTPVIAPLLNAFVPAADLLHYTAAVLRAYNWFGRRDNIYKARIKILVKAQFTEFAQQVEAEFQAILQQDGAPHRITPNRLQPLIDQFTAPEYALEPNAAARRAPSSAGEQTDYLRFIASNRLPNRYAGYCAVLICVKSQRAGQLRVAGDLTADDMDAIANLAMRFSAGEIRVTKEQNLLLPWVKETQLAALYAELATLGLTEVLSESFGDMICCPGGDYCALANARSIPVAQAVQLKFVEQAKFKALGPIDFHLSGCINSCGHHHSGHIGILGVDKDGQEFYQISVGGSDGRRFSGPPQAGKVIGASVRAQEVPLVVEQILNTYLQNCDGSESFIENVRRLGAEHYKRALDITS
jgi:sulfite reductase (NADPH) hemoprotein beta-component